MPLTYDEFMKQTDNKGFSPEEKEMLGSFGKSLKKAYKSVNAADENSEEYKEFSELREALSSIQENSLLEPNPDDDEEEKKKKWDEDLQKLVWFVNLLRSGRNLSYYSNHAFGGVNGTEYRQQYPSLLKMLNDKLKADIEIDEHKDRNDEIEYIPEAKEENKEEKREKEAPLDEDAIIEQEIRNKREKEEILKEWEYVGGLGEQDIFLKDILRSAKGLNAKHLGFIEEKTDELKALKEAVGEYNIYLMNKSEGTANEIDEKKYLKKIEDAAEKYIAKTRGDDPLHPEDKKADNWQPLFKKNRVRFESAKEILDLTKARLNKVEKEYHEADAKAKKQDNKEKSISDQSEKKILRKSKIVQHIQKKSEKKEENVKKRSEGEHDQSQKQAEGKNRKRPVLSQNISESENKKTQNSASISKRISSKSDSKKSAGHKKSFGKR